MKPDQHEIYRRRRSRNVGVGLALGALVVLIFAVSYVKMSRGELGERFQHTLRPQMVPGQTEAAEGATSMRPSDEQIVEQGDAVE
ncbi:hypothetical protein ACMA5I_03220 [Paracoccaceae bacterium GXU_MW_L88]